MHKLESDQENEMPEIIWNFYLQTVKNKNRKSVVLWILSFQQTTKGKSNITKRETITYTLPGN